jgi:hypothetical protein
VNRQQHWNTVYTTKGERDVSWFEASPDVSVEMIEAAGLARDACVLGVGGGDSRVVAPIPGGGKADLKVRLYDRGICD